MLQQVGDIMASGKEFGIAALTELASLRKGGRRQLYHLLNCTPRIPKEDTRLPKGYAGEGSAEANV